MELLGIDLFVIEYFNKFFSVYFVLFKLKLFTHFPLINFREPRSSKDIFNRSKLHILVLKLTFELCVDKMT